MGRKNPMTWYKRLRYAELLATVVVAIFASTLRIAAKNPSMEVYLSPSTILSIHQTAVNGIIYGRETHKAAWHVSQWNNPSGNINDFRDGIASNASLSVSVRAPEPSSITIDQSGRQLPCLTQGIPTEFDGYIGANTAANNPGLPSAEGNMPSNSIEDLHALVQQLDVTSISSSSIGNMSCNVSKAVGLIAVVFSDLQSNQTFFLQIMVFAFNTKPSAVWWAQGKQNGRFGYNFVYPTVNHNWSATEAHHINVDLLPIVYSLVDNNVYGMDKNRRNWKISGAYFGNAVYGKVSISTNWKNYQLIAN